MTELTEEPIRQGNRTSIIDHYVHEDIKDESSKYKYHDFVKLNGIGKKFQNINFEHCTFDTCYFKNCVFDSCSFIGCRFVSSNLHQSAFIGCDFRYATFDKTLIDYDILEKEAPLEENLRMHFARSLRMNYQQIGDAKAVNNAISLELKTTADYLFKSWASSETYYHKKYVGWKKLAQLFRWLEFKALDLLWGNGESVLKLLRTLVTLIFIICIFDTINYHDGNNIQNYISGISKAAAMFFGFNIPNDYPSLPVAIIAASRLTFFALFTAILVKRFSRR